MKGQAGTLRHALAGYWSRRIDDEHRLVYKIDKDAVVIAQARYHYELGGDAAVIPLAIVLLAPHPSYFTVPSQHIPLGDSPCLTT